MKQHHEYAEVWGRDLLGAALVIYGARVLDVREMPYGWLLKLRPEVDAS